MNITANITAGLPAFVITLREGVEAALVVGIVLAALAKAGRSQQLNRFVYWGIAAGIAASVGVGLGLNQLLVGVARSQQPYAPALQQGLQTGFGLVAIGLLSWMLIWMTQQAKSLKGEIEGAVGQQLDAPEPDATDSTHSNLASRGIFSLIFLAVLREGFETVVFLAAQFQEGWIPTAGAIAGLMGATAIGVGFFKLGVRINLKQFFQVMGLLLLLIVGGLVIGTLSHGDRALLAAVPLSSTVATFCGTRDTCILGFQLWDLHEQLSDRVFPGIVLKTFFGYRSKLYAVQAIAWVSFMFGMGGLYWRSLNPKISNPKSE
jgi:high-affinity iron transporter